MSVGSPTSHRRLRFSCARNARRAAHLIALAVPAVVQAGVGFNSGSATWSWDPDTLAAGRTVFAITPPPSGSIPTYQLSKNETIGSATATGRGSIGYVTNATTATFTLAGGSGSSQADPNDNIPGDTVTKVVFSGLFDVTSPSFGPTATGYVSITVGGTAGIGGYATVAGDFSFKLNSSAGANLRTPINFTDTFLGGGSPTPFSKTYTYSSALSPSTIASGNKVFVSGSLTFISSNFGSPSDVVPVQIEVGGAPPTATCFVRGGNVGAWFDQLTWTAPDNPAAGVFAFTESGALVPPIPNGVGQRARFVDVGPEQRLITLDQTASIGALHIDDDNSVSISPGPTTGTLVFNTQAGNATVYVGAAAGEASHDISVPVTLADNLEISTASSIPFEGGSVIRFNAPINSVGGPKQVEIRGSGAVQYNAANSYGGQTIVSEGAQLQANAPGALGNGLVTVTGGAELALNTNQPFGPGGGTVDVAEGGLVNLNVPDVQNININIASGRDTGFSGSPAELGLLNIGTASSGSISVATGQIFVGHTVFDTSQTGNPSGLDTGFPEATFGMVANATDPGDGSITIGSDSGTPWFAFGGGVGNFTYGADPNNPTGQAVNVTGDAALLSVAGSMTLNAPLTGGAEPNVLSIEGGGVVVLKSTLNTYIGSVNVLSGTLQVDGTLPNVGLVTVGPGANLGGDGSISGAVIVADTATVDPGINSFNNVAASLTVVDLSLSNASILDFEFGASGTELNDVVNVTGDLVLDGLLVINQLQDFDTQGTYTLFNYSGLIDDNGLVISSQSQEIFGRPASQAASILIIPNPLGPGGTVVLMVPEPACGVALLAAGLLGRRRRQ